jgi:hypothetical protein
MPLSNLNFLSLQKQSIPIPFFQDTENKKSLVWGVVGNLGKRASGYRAGFPELRTCAIGNHTTCAFYFIFFIIFIFFSLAFA